MASNVLENFWLQVGDRVRHLKDPSWVGTVASIDENLIVSHGVTTCGVIWDDGDGEYQDVQWTNKLEVLT